MKHRKVDNLKTDCFAFKGCEFQQFCNALAGVKSCVGCNFYKTKERIQEEEALTRRRLRRMGIVYDPNKGGLVK